MNTDITITLTEAEAREYLTVVRPRGNNPLALMQRKVADALPPVYAEGTVARVYFGAGESEGVSFAEWRDGEWKYANGVGLWATRNSVTRVEPIRVLADNEIAMTRDVAAEDLRHAEDVLNQHGTFPNTCEWLLDVANRLDAADKADMAAES